MIEQTAVLMTYLKLPPTSVEVWPAFALEMLSEPQFGLVQYDSAEMSKVRHMYAQWVAGRPPARRDWEAVAISLDENGTNLQHACAINATHSLAWAAVGINDHVETCLVRASGTQGKLTREQFDNIVDGNTPFLQMYLIKARATVEQLLHRSRAVEVDL